MHSARGWGHQAVASAVEILLLLHLMLLLHVRGHLIHVRTLAVHIQRLSLLLIHLRRGHEAVPISLLMLLLLLLLVIVGTPPKVHLEFSAEQGNSLHGFDGIIGAA